MEQARIISILNHKGGVGKTTSTINIGAGLALKGASCLLIDIDPQANLTQSLGLATESDANIYSALRGDIDHLPIVTKKPGLDVVPSTLDLSAAESELNSEIGREFILQRLLTPLRAKYGYILIDCPPSLGLLTINALAASTGLIIPVQAEYLALRGMTKLLEVIKMVQSRVNPALQLEGMLLTQYDSRKGLNRTVNDLIRERYNTNVFDTVIRSNVALAEAPISCTDIFEASPKSAGAVDYMAVCEEILKQTK